MLMCEQCEFYQRDPAGRVILRCNPFSTIKEPECLQKLQLFRLEQLVQYYQAMLRFYQNLAPMQKKMFDFMKREMDDIEDADRWKYEEDASPPEDSQEEGPFSR